jgi:hypothetical protein
MNEAVNAKPSGSSRKSSSRRPAVEGKSERVGREAAEPGLDGARKKKAARSTSKRRPTSSSAATPLAKHDASKPHAAGPGGRKLVTREEAELELPANERLLPAGTGGGLPDAPLRKVARRRRDAEGSDLEGTGT